MIVTSCTHIARGRGIDVYKSFINNSIQRQCDLHGVQGVVGSNPAVPTYGKTA